MIKEKTVNLSWPLKDGGILKAQIINDKLMYFRHYENDHVYHELPTDVKFLTVIEETITDLFKELDVIQTPNGPIYRHQLPPTK